MIFDRVLVWVLGKNHSWFPKVFLPRCSLKYSHEIANVFQLTFLTSSSPVFLDGFSYGDLFGDSFRLSDGLSLGFLGRKILGLLVGVPLSRYWHQFLDGLSLRFWDDLSIGFLLDSQKESHLVTCSGSQNNFHLVSLLGSQEEVSHRFSEMGVFLLRLLAQIWE
jgi:hypothetical protein